MMRPLRESLTRLLEVHEPNPALIVDGLWNLIEANRAASLLWQGVDPELLEPPINMLRLAVHSGGLEDLVDDRGLQRAADHEAEAKESRRRQSGPRRADRGCGVHLPDDPPTSPATQPVVSLDLRTLGEVSLFTVIATLGAPLEVTAADLAIETFLPMDERSAARLRELSERGRGG